MRHNQNARRMRGRGGNGGGHHHHHHGSSGQHGNRRVNPRVQTFDSNGPEVRIRGTAYQINEKYVTLARDAASAGDRVLAESYLQHAEHYQRFINEMTEEFNQYNQQQQQSQPQPLPPVQVDGNGAVGVPQADGLSDLDQGFLVGPRHNGGGVANGSAEMQPASVPDQSQQQAQSDQPSGNRYRTGGRHHSSRRNEPEAV